MLSVCSLHTCCYGLCLFCAYVGVWPLCLFCAYMGCGLWVGRVGGLQLLLLLGQLQGDDAFGLRLHTFTPELELGVDGAVEHKVLLQALGVEGTDRGVMADLLRYQPEAKVLSDTPQCDGAIRVMVMFRVTLTLIIRVMVHYNEYVELCIGQLASHRLCV